jgi:nicotinate-nucleotide adenylyltransferase
MKKIGLFGGTFDPIHIGHLKIAELFVTLCDLSSCYFIPNQKSPFKIDKINKFSAEERCEKIKKAISINPKFELCDFELKKAEISYSIETILHFREKFPTSELYFLIGSDQAKDFEKWKDFRKILEIIALVIATRPEGISEIEKSEIEQKLNNSKNRIIWLNNPIFDITSTMIRKKL